MHPGWVVQLLLHGWQRSGAAPQGQTDAHNLLLRGRSLLQGNGPGQPQVGGFQAAKYFTYVFFALAISVVLLMVVLCSAHCYRRNHRNQRQRAARAVNSANDGGSEVHIQIAPPGDRQLPANVPLKVFDAVLVQHPDGSNEVAYDPDRPSHILEPDLSARQKALAARALRRSPRIAVSLRLESEDSRARRRRQALEASVARQQQQQQRAGHRGGGAGLFASRDRRSSEARSETGTYEERLAAAAEEGSVRPFYSDSPQQRGSGEARQGFALGPDSEDSNGGGRREFPFGYSSRSPGSAGRSGSRSHRDSRRHSRHQRGHSSGASRHGSSGSRESGRHSSGRSCTQQEGNT